MIYYERLSPVCMPMVHDFRIIPSDEIVFRAHVSHDTLERPDATIVGAIEHAKLILVLIPAGVHLDTAS